MCVCVSVLVCVHVCNFPLLRSRMGLEKTSGHAVSTVQSLALGRPHGTHSFGQVCVIHTRNSGWRVQCVFLFFCNYFIKCLVGNFTLALTDLAEAA